MLAVPVLEDRNSVDVSEVLPGQLSGGSPCLVRCPIVCDMFIDEGLCYDVQAFALGKGPKHWRILSADEFSKALNCTAENLRRVCLGHQLQLIKQGRCDGDFTAEIQIQLNLIDGDL